MFGCYKTLGSLEVDLLQIRVTSEWSNDIQTRINPIFGALADVGADSFCGLKWLQLLALETCGRSPDIRSGMRIGNPIRVWMDNLESA